MTRDPTDNTDQDSSAQAFEELRGEVSLTRRAVEGLTAARERLPDYSETLGTMSEALSAALTRLERIERSPAMRLTPEAMAIEFTKASASARAGDRDNLSKADAALRSSIASIHAVVEQAWTADRQLKHLCLSGGGGIVLGILGALATLHFFS